MYNRTFVTFKWIKKEHKTECCYKSRFLTTFDVPTKSRKCFWKKSESLSTFDLRKILSKDTKIENVTRSIHVLNDSLRSIV